MKVLTANSYIPANTPVIECRGKYMLASQLHNNSRSRAADFVLYHKITPELEVCIDSKTYGNDSRFCRRSDAKTAESNAEVSNSETKCCIILVNVQFLNLFEDIAREAPKT